MQTLQEENQNESVSNFKLNQESTERKYSITFLKLHPRLILFFLLNDGFHPKKNNNRLFTVSKQGLNGTIQGVDTG